MIETERKYLNIRVQHLRAQLVFLGARSEGWHYENNIVFDTDGKRLFSQGELLRLRVQEWASKKTCLLTFKQRISETGALVKAREEIETQVEDGAAMFSIVSALGFGAVARYEKMREQWHFDARSQWHGINVDVDILPFGNVAELEGPPELLDGLASALGLDKNEISLKTYHELNQEWREAAGLPHSLDLLFDEAAIKALRKDLGLA